MSIGDGKAVISLAARLNAARDRHFTGRSAELAQFRAALTGERRGIDETGSCAVLFFHGPGGIGKTTLLRRFATEALAARRAVVEIDGRSIDPSPAAFEAEAVLTEPGTVLLVDTFEECRGLEVWLREKFLPRLPADTLVVLAGRQAPGLEWRSDPGWADALRVMQMQNLSPEDAKAMLTARGVTEELHQPMLTFTGGHPLALSLAAELASHNPGTSPLSWWRPSPDVVELLLARLVGDLPSTAHRYALEVASHVRYTTEELLRAGGVDNPANMFNWLRTLPFIESAPHGLYPHDVVRDSLDADLRWRDPQGYETMHRLLRKHLLARGRAAQGAAILPAMGDLNYLRRYGGVMPQMYRSGRDGEVFEDAYRPTDRPAVLKLASTSRAAFSAELMEFWLDRQPEACFVHRRSDTGELVAFIALLKLTSPTDDEIATDPVVAAAWTHCQTHGPLRHGEHLGLARFMVYSPTYQPPSPVQGLIMQRLLATMMHTEHMAWSFLTTTEPAFWEPLMNYIDHHLVQMSPVHADLGFGSFAHDWRAVPLDVWFELLEPWELFGPEPRQQTRTEELAVLSRSEFDTAVRDALRSSRHRDLLATNPLTRSRIVTQSSTAGGVTEARDPITVLQHLLANAVDALRDDPQQVKLHRVLATTYFHRIRTQESAAEQLLLSLSTYRRHLKLAHQRLSDILWHQEIRGTKPS